MLKINVPTAERGTTRVFSLSMQGNQAVNLIEDPRAQLEWLGAPDLDPAGVEVVALNDLGDLGLIGYLREGVDAQESDLRRDAAKLVALEGHVLLLHSTAFGGKAVTLTPDPMLTLIGTYAQTPPNNRTVSLGVEAAQPYTGAAPTQATTSTSQRGLGSLVVLLCALMGIALLWFILG